LDDPELFKAFFAVIQHLNAEGLLLAYHDRSDGGLLATLCEMAFAGRMGLEIRLDELGGEPVKALFNEELGAVIQVRRDDAGLVLERLEVMGLASCSHNIGRAVHHNQAMVLNWRDQELIRAERGELQRLWSETSYRMQALRDNPDCARQQFEALVDDTDPGLHAELSFDPEENVCIPFVNLARPKMAILREQGVNGHVEMAAAFDAAGFDCRDVHMSDLASGAVRLADFTGLAACGGFSYGDVLGAGGGWARSILFNERLRQEFAAFFQRPETFGLGVCNGCQMLSQIQELIPGAAHWPRFLRNHSEQFEARVTLVRVETSPSILLQGMEGSRMPVVVAHGEGRAAFAPESPPQAAHVSLRYVDGHGQATERFPYNPNGSPEGVTGVTTDDGRFTILMPHPERCFRSLQNSWRSPHWGEYGPWMRMFRNARIWVG
jgi:phosphoribosylformylglycinamidine synthase